MRLNPVYMALVIIAVAGLVFFVTRAGCLHPGPR